MSATYSHIAVIHQKLPFERFSDNEYVCSPLIAAHPRIRMQKKIHIKWSYFRLILSLKPVQTPSIPQGGNQMRRDQDRDLNYKGGFYANK